VVIPVADESTEVVPVGQRKRIYLQADPDNTENIRVELSQADAVVEDGLILLPGGSIDEDHDGAVNAIHMGTGGTQALIVVEL
jgi:hypothetical protein